MVLKDQFGNMDHSARCCLPDAFTVARPRDFRKKERTTLTTRALVSNKNHMRLVMIAAVVPIVLMPTRISPQAKPASAPKSGAADCALRVVRQPTSPNHEVRRHQGEKATGYAPIVTFEILESGEVRNARIKRSSGMANVDALALDWVRSAQYGMRPGCGVITSDASVDIDFH